MPRTRILHDDTRVLVTGASGFIGTRSIHHLLSAGYEVHPWYHGRPSAPDPSGHAHFGDLLKEADQIRVLRESNPAHLLHLAWYAVPGKFWSSPENLLWSAASLQLLLHFAQGEGERCLVAGTCAEYEWQPETLCKETETPIRPRSLYGICKNSVREIISVAASQLKIQVAWGRIFFVYGPHEAGERFVPSVVCPLLQDQVSLCTEGKQMRDFMHVDDVARAFVTVLESGATGAVNIASGTPVSLNQIATTIADQLGKRHLLKLGGIETRADDPLKLVANTSRLNGFGFKPRFDLDSGLADTIAWWRNKIISR